MEFLLAIAGIAATFYVAYKQKKKGRIQVVADVQEKHVDPHSDRDFLYMNSDAEWEVNITLKVKSKYRLPVRIGSFILSVPNGLPLWAPKLIVKNWPFSRNVQLKSRGYKLPAQLPPGDILKEIYLTGLEVANNLKERGYSGTLTFLIGVIDENNNIYLSNPVNADLDKWLKERGQFIMGFI